MADREGVTLHFHVRQNDAGYMPDPDNVATHEAVDDAIEDMIERLDLWADDVSRRPADEITRGQPHHKNPWTYGEELVLIDEELARIKHARDTTDLSLEVAQNGMFVPLEAGMSIISIDPCSMQECEEHRDEWVT